MNNETQQFLATVACIAEETLRYLRDQESDDIKPRDRGAGILMSAYLELYGQTSQGNSTALKGPSELVRHAATTCVAMRHEMQTWPKTTWRDDEHGLHQLMLAFMFLYKRTYVIKH